MRCLSCNKVLSDYEATRKSEVTGEYVDLCSSCLSSVKESYQSFKVVKGFSKNFKEKDNEVDL